MKVGTERTGFFLLYGLFLDRSRRGTHRPVMGEREREAKN